ASGAVLEVGAGTGANLAYYPPSAEKIALVEPDPHMRRRLDRAVRRMPSRERFEVHEGDASALPFAAGSFDTVVTTLLLCSVPEASRALEEIARVLRPEGQLLYLEHIAAPLGSSLRRLQERVEPFWKHIAGNCHVTRSTLESIEGAGLVPMYPRAEEMRRAPPWIRPTIRGCAVKPAMSA
ncbi:MAG: class I SAM-dependent methyltransferase, partial [Polyangiaceae bacterium]|nr:class I SAM-dependent methyltransferase [Polyangiaceae bacterium]